MRKRTLTGLCFLLAFAIAILFRYFLGRIQLPVVGEVSALAVGTVLVPLLLILLSVLNTHLLNWRKAHGRDIELEEKHEFEGADIISLRPRQSHEHSSTYKRWGE